MPPSLRDYFSAAVQLKTALVKAKPGRQEWEAAPPFMRCTAAAVDSVRDVRQHDFAAQYDTALRLKEQGNELVAQDPAAALERYAQAVAVFLWFDRGPDRAAEDVPLLCSADRLQGAEREQAHHLLALALCNAAACLLQLGLAEDAAYACSKALKYDSYNVKALYRRAVAQRQADTTAGLEAAAADLAAANRLEPANHQVRLALAAVNEELREQRRKDRGLYGNMFTGGTELYGEQGHGREAGTRGALQDGGDFGAAAVCRGGGEGRGEEEEADGGDESGSSSWRDHEDPQEAALRKSASASHSREADVAIRRMRRQLAHARSRKLAAQLGGGGAAAGARGGRFTFPWWAVPWWAYSLILLHLAYRIIKVWRAPLPSGSGLAPTGEVEALGGHSVLHTGHSEL